MKGNSFASVLGLGGQKRGKWGRTFGGGGKKIYLLLYFQNKDGLQWGGAKTVSVLKFILLNFVPVFFFS